MGEIHMALGASPLGTTPLGTSVPLFRAEFDVEAQVEGQSAIQIASFVDRALIEQLRKYPDDLRTINRRLFEELVAELFVSFGYEVELTKRTRDGGKDIIAIKRKEVETRFLIECKRPDPGKAIGISFVRELYGVKVDDGATKAILATTTYFSPDAKLFFEKHRWELEPRDFDAVQAWIADYLAQSPTVT